MILRGCLPMSLRVSALQGLLTFIFICIVARSHPMSAGEHDMQAVRRVAESWLALIDRGAYEESWDRIADIFRDRLEKGQWLEKLKANRGLLGGVKLREFRSAQYVIELADKSCR
jgi:hypothetical protein